MGIFRNANEVNYASGRKHFTDVIKNQGRPSDLIYLAGEEDFNNNSTLIVDESQEAIFMKDGLIHRIFTPGSYVLNTDNYPFLSRLRNMMSGGVSTFNCKVYFVKKSLVKEFYWGTDSAIQVRDPNLKIQTELTARGAYKVRVVNSEYFLTRLTGSQIKNFTDDELTQFFRSQFLAYIKSTVAKVIMESNQEILGINARQLELAERIAPSIENALEPYGLKLVDFSIESIDIAGDENRKNIEAGYAGLILSKVHAQGEKLAAEELGLSYLDKRTLDILQDIAQNPGAGGTAAAGAGIGAGMAAGEWMYRLLSGMKQQPFDNYDGFGAGREPQQAPPRSFVQKPAQTNAPPAVDPGEEKLTKLKNLLDKGLLSQEKYDLAVEEVLQQILNSN